MGLTFFRRLAGQPRRLGILPGAFNPPTRAHLALAKAALALVDEVLFVLPRELPHKSYFRVSFGDRLTLLHCAIEEEPRYSLASSDGGLFVEIAREAREHYSGPLYFLCGRDAAERIVTWDYGQPADISTMLEEFELLVASRNGGYHPPDNLKHRIHALALNEPYDHIAATEVRNRVGRDESWRELVPETIAGAVEHLYSRLLA